MEFEMASKSFTFEDAGSRTHLTFERGTYDSKSRQYVLENVTLVRFRECRDGMYGRTKPFTTEMISIVKDGQNYYLVIENEHNDPNAGGKVLGELETETDATSEDFFKEFADVLFESKKRDYIEEALSFVAQDYYHEQKSALMYVDTQSYSPVYLAALTKEDAEKLGIATL